MPSWEAVGAIILPYIGGFTGSFITRKNIKSWYENLDRPSWRPPNWLFGPVWTTLYGAMGYSSYLVYRGGGGSLPLGLYASQLALNWAWTPLFFGSHNVKAAFYEVCLLWLNVAACGVFFYQVDPAAGLLLVPYQAWLTLAAALNYSVWTRNGDMPAGLKIKNEQ